MKSAEYYRRPAQLADLLAAARSEEARASDKPGNRSTHGSSPAMRRKHIAGLDAAQRAHSTS